MNEPVWWIFLCKVTTLMLNCRQTSEIFVRWAANEARVRLPSGLFFFWRWLGFVFGCCLNRFTGWAPRRKEIVQWVHLSRSIVSVSEEGDEPMSSAQLRLRRWTSHLSLTPTDPLRLSHLTSPSSEPTLSDQEVTRPGERHGARSYKSQWRVAELEFFMFWNFHLKKEFSFFCLTQICVLCFAETEEIRSSKHLPDSSPPNYLGFLNRFCSGFMCHPPRTSQQSCVQHVEWDIVSSNHIFQFWTMFKMSYMNQLVERGSSVFTDWCCVHTGHNAEIHLVLPPDSDTHANTRKHT